jgi:hypothetical protein
MLEVDSDDDAALPSTELCQRQRVMVVVFVAFFCGFDLSILQGFYVGLVQNMRFWCGNLVKTRWKKPFNCCQFRSIFSSFRYLTKLASLSYCNNNVISCGSFTLFY